MPQTTQIIPKWTFPHVETYINDYTAVTDDAIAAVADTSVKEVLAVISSKGIDNTWVKKSTRESAVKTFGDSNFNLYGQPLMQALNVADQADTSIWMMRVMPESATYSNNVVCARYKADTDESITKESVLARKFRIKLVHMDPENESTKTDAARFENIKTVKELQEAANSFAAKDAKNWDQAEIMTIRSSGRGTYGQNLSLRIVPDTTYQKEFGIILYDFEALSNESGLTKEANYVGAPVTSAKYYSDGVTLINDVLDDAEVGLAPIDVRINEDNVEVVYNEYIKFIKKLHTDAVSVADPSAPDEELLALIDATDDSELPDLDEFDIFFGLKVNSTESLPAIVFMTQGDSEAETTTTDPIVDFNSTTGLYLINGSNGEFDTPSEGMTKAEEINKCYINAFNGTYDSRILSNSRMDLTAIFDANYDYEVKEVLYDLVVLRDSCRLYLDVNIQDNISMETISALAKKYSIFDDKLVSVDIHNYQMRDSATGKKCTVTITYFLAETFANHINAGNFYIPMVKSYCQLSGHIKNSLAPVIDDYEKSKKESLYENRLNYFEPITENVFQRATQNTTQLIDSDCLEENNMIVLYTLKKQIELDANDQIYNFADSSIRTTFVNTEKAKFANWAGTYVEDFSIYFSTSAYEFNHQIMHLYISVTFRGLNKAIITEIDINKRTQSTESTAE